jgi:hypothetical protein
MYRSFRYPRCRDAAPDKTTLALAVRSDESLPHVYFVMDPTTTSVTIKVTSSETTVQGIDAFPVHATKLSLDLEGGTSDGKLDTGRCWPAAVSTPVVDKDWCLQPSQGVDVALAADLAGFAFYADEQCTTPTTKMTLGGEAAARCSSLVYLKATTPGVVHATATAPGYPDFVDQATFVDPATSP